MTRLLPLVLLAVLVEPAAAGWRCARPKPNPALGPPPRSIKRPTVKQVKAAVTKQDFVLGSEVTYALDWPGDSPEAVRCRQALGTTGTADDATELGTLTSCLGSASGIAGSAKRTWKAITAKQVPTRLAGLAGDLSSVDKQHLIVTATTKDAAALYVAHREDTRIVIETIIAAAAP